MPRSSSEIRLWVDDENNLAGTSAALEQLVSTGRLGQRNALCHHRLDPARRQRIEKLRQRLAVPGAVRLSPLPGMRGHRRPLAVGNEHEQETRRQAEWG